MSHTIKLEDQVYDQLEKFRNKRETFSEAVERLLRVKDGIDNLVGVLVGQKTESDRAREELDKAAATHR